MTLLIVVRPAAAAEVSAADKFAQVKGFKVEFSGASTGGAAAVDSAWKAVVVPDRSLPIRVTLTCFQMVLSRTGVYVSGLGQTLRMSGSGMGSNGRLYFISLTDDGAQERMTVSNVRGTGPCETIKPSKVVTLGFGFALKARI